MQINKEKQPLKAKIPMYTIYRNQDTTQLLRPQQEASVFDASDFVATIRNIQDISSQFMLFCFIYTNIDQKMLARARKPEIS